MKQKPLKSNSMVRTRKIVLLGFSLAVAMILSYLESLIPPFFSIPGIKLGLSNILTVFLLYRLNARSAAAVSLLRVTLSSLLFGTAVSFVYGFSGAILSLAAMIILRKLFTENPRFSLSEVGVSVAGGVCHNLAQIAVAAFLLDTAQIWFYFPVLLITGTVSGILVGIAGGSLTKLKINF